MTAFRSIVLFAAVAALMFPVWSVSPDAIGQDIPPEVLQRMQQQQAQAQQNAQQAAAAWEAAIKDLEKQEGLFTLYTGEGKALLELNPLQLNRPFICMSSIGRGLATGGFVNGMTLSTEVLAFAPGPDETVRLVAKNVRFRRPDGPLQRAFDISFSDSPIRSLKPIAKRGPLMLIDLGELFLTDFNGVGQALPGFFQDRSQSQFSQAKVFPTNVELRANMVFQSRGGANVPSIPDSRGLEVIMHYSLSAMPQPGYQPRTADNRVGYFTTTLYDFRQPEDGGYVTYINRWRLEKADPAAAKSPAKNPIVFWIENTVPWEYRPYVRQGIEAWNRAFEEAGILNAIEARQMPDDATWDPEDARYNTVRWTAAWRMGFAIGPSRVNPLTGEIMDADVLIDANFVRGFEQYYRLSHAVDDENAGEDNRMPIAERRNVLRDMLVGNERMTPESIRNRIVPQQPDPFAEFIERQNPMAQQMRCEVMRRPMLDAQWLGAAALLDGDDRMVAVNEDGLPEGFIGRALRDLVMHEVGHTLGLRHNFRASTLRTVEELGNKELIEEQGFSGSVMDYHAMFVSADPENQGYYSMPDIGPYDVWAIRYGYTQGAQPQVDAIAAESGKPEHLYGTDEDARFFFVGHDPYCDVWDMGSEPLDFAQNDIALIKRLWQQDWSKVAENHPDDRVAVRRAFWTLLNRHHFAVFRALGLVGGFRNYRHHVGDEGAQDPVQPISREKMQAAIDFVITESIRDDAWNFPNEVLRQLAPSRNWDWGRMPSFYLYVPVADEILWERLQVLYFLHSAWLITTLNEMALMDPDTLSPESVFAQLTDEIWGGFASGNMPSAGIRALQQEHLNLLMWVWTAGADAGYPARGRLAARVMLSRIRDTLRGVNPGNDVAMQVHVEGLLALVNDCLEAQPTRSAR